MAIRKKSEVDPFEEREKWCPLRPMPNRDPISEEMMDDETKGFGCAFNTGWNNCLDEIGEDDEDTL